MKKILLVTFLGGLAFYFGILGSLYLSQRKMIYFPEREKQNFKEYTNENLEFANPQTSDGLILEGWYKSPQKDNPVIVVFHGNASHMGLSMWKVQSFVKEGYGALLPAYRGYAGNPGKPTEKGLYLDAQAFIEWLINEKNIPQERIILLGESLGSGVAIEMAANYFPNVKAVILESPYTSFVDMAQDKFSYIPFLNILVRDKYKSLDKIKNVKAPLLIVHGKLDIIVPFHMGKAVFEAANDPKQMVELPAAGHNDLYIHGAGQRVLHFLSGL